MLRISICFYQTVKLNYFYIFRIRLTKRSFNFCNFKISLSKGLIISSFFTIIRHFFPTFTTHAVERVHVHLTAPSPFFLTLIAFHSRVTSGSKRRTRKSPKGYDNTSRFFIRFQTHLTYFSQHRVRFSVILHSSL